jgi:hypothetical protein
MNKQFNILLKVCKELDNKGKFAQSDKIFNKIAQYYPQQSVTKVPHVNYVEYEEIEDEYKENDFFRQKIKPNRFIRDYFDLGGEADGPNIEGMLHGPDSVPGPAFVDPGNPASSPSMAIQSGDDIDDRFSWEETYQKNVEDGNGWKNRLPYR